MLSYFFLVPVFVLMARFAYLMYVYRNPYKLIMVFGKKGSGKTTFLTKTAVQALRKGRQVYSTVAVPGCHLFDVNAVGKFSFPPGSVVLIDEVGMIWDNRDFRNFRPHVRDYFKLQRHYRNTVYLFSQTFDVDIKLRNLTDAMYMCRCYFGFLSVARKIRRFLTIVHPEGESESRIADDIQLVPLWQSLFGAASVRFTYIPRWARYFDSHEVPGLPLVESRRCPSLPPAPSLRSRLGSASRSLAVRASVATDRTHSFVVLCSSAVRRWWGQLRHPHH